MRVTWVRSEPEHGRVETVLQAREPFVSGKPSLRSFHQTPIYIAESKGLRFSPLAPLDKFV